MGAVNRFIPLIVILASWPSFVRAEASIAFSQQPDGGWKAGWSYNNKTQIEADNLALQHCGEQGGTNCTNVGNFNSSCTALAVQVGNNGWAVRYGRQDQARRDALKACIQMGLPCRVQASFCDAVKEVVETLICTHPVFTEEERLRLTLLNDPSAAQKVAAAITYLRDKYCRTIEEVPASDQDEQVHDNCSQHSGMYRGERVYWGECAE